jgi:PIN domain nuclease of toxin-antitoxin system
MGLISYLDTNIVIYLHSGNRSRVTHRAQEQIESTDLLESAMVPLQLQMLYEKGAILHAASQILSDLSQQIGLSVCQLPFASVVKAAAEQVKWTREPGDRLIVANAIANNQSPIVTSDRNIQANYDNAIW